MVRRAGRGFTLIEVAVVLVIVALVVLVGVPLTRAWVANAHISQAESQLLQAYARTRALALRNPVAVSGTGSAATLVITGSGSLAVQNASGTVWSGTAASDVTVALTATACGNQLALDNNGLPTNTACMAYQISATGGSNATGTLR